MCAGPVRTASLFAVVLWDFGCKPAWLSELGVSGSSFGGCSDVAALDVQSKLFPLQEKLGVGDSFHPDSMGCGLW